MFNKIDDKLKKHNKIGNKEVKNLKTAALKSMPAFKNIENVVFKNKCPVEQYKIEQHLELYAVENRPILFKIPSGQVLPHLKYVIEYPDLLPCVYVDDGAVRALLRGATLMAPGIKQVPQPFESGDVLAIRLLEQEAAFAVGVAVVSSEEMAKNPKGDAIDIKHILKDGLWEHRDGL
ncbi:Translation machinery-associated protein 20 [Tritrichomonas foetus]|uniref:Translation machinery-associated protein 20 n=1 Tax=Tritrichomonas foetus TaxID=1144522 RepID=A0A1J4KN38_9EUKA|nr:Translation machinery-associated protein 20 [Tritrichomonas foetus]|eukprot:OHT12729.1 Translation machinery-associated protein 20 [Tritrichomonas foetus]